MNKEMKTKTPFTFLDKLSLSLLVFMVATILVSQASDVLFPEAMLKAKLHGACTIIQSEFLNDVPLAEKTYHVNWCRMIKGSGRFSEETLALLD